MSRLTVAWVTSKPCPRQRIDELAAGWRPARDATSWRMARWRSRLRSCDRGASRCAAPSRAGAAGRAAVMRVPKRRVVERALERVVRADESAMIASAPSQPSAASAARTLGTMPPAMTPPSMRCSASADGQRVELVAVGVADAVDVGQQDQLARAETGRDARRRVVGVDVADDAVLVARERRDDRAPGRRRGSRRAGRAAARRRCATSPSAGSARR